MKRGIAVEEYFRAKPMLTPAVAGMATMTITATIVQYLAVPAALVALATSFLFGLLAWSDRSVPLLPRGALYVVYSITIFSVAVGINETAVGLKEDTSHYQYESRSGSPDKDAGEKEFIRSWF
jgi:hypothetical protein